MKELLKALEKVCADNTADQIAFLDKVIHELIIFSNKNDEYLNPEGTLMLSNITEKLQKIEELKYI